jgi:hypothetical protein
MSEEQNFYISPDNEKQDGLNKLGKAMAGQDMCSASVYKNNIRKI